MDINCLVLKSEQIVEYVFPVHMQAALRCFIIPPGKSYTFSMCTGFGKTRNQNTVPEIGRFALRLKVTQCGYWLNMMCITLEVTYNS